MTLEEPNRNSEEEIFVFPASSAQQRLWFLDQLVPDASLYNVPTVIRLIGVLNLAALEQSFKAIVSRHEALRTTFETVEGQPIQIIAPKLEVSLPVINLQQLPALTRDAEAQLLIRKEIQRPFNLSKGPLLRLMLLRLDEAEHILLVNLHHIVFDEWSSGVLIGEFGTFYAAFTQDQRVSLPELPVQYADFAHWQQEWLQGEVLELQLNYWRQQLRNVPTLDLLNDRPRPPAQSYRGAVQLLELPQSLLSGVEELSQQSGVSLFMTLLAAFQALLYRYTGQTDIAVGSPIANRNRSELEGLIGFFVNSLVLRTDLSGNPTFQELLGRVREVALEAYAHQDLPFEKLVEELQPTRDLSRNPLFQVVFALQNAPMEQLTLPGLTLSSLNFETRTTRFDLELYLWKCSDNFRSLWGKGWEHSEGLRGVAVYNTDLFEATTITRFLKHFQTLLEGIVASPTKHLADLPLLTTTEWQQVLNWNDTQTEYPANQCIHQLFEAQTERSPNAVAVRFADHQFTYQELNRGSNQLAHYLQKLGVGPEVPVGLCMEPSAAAVAGMLGILKAGGAYVPLDPTSPPERLRFMLEDAQVSVLLSNRGSGDFDGWGVKVVCLDQDWQAIAQQSEANPISQVVADNLAYVIYTSGSTGQPKGVAVTHRAVNRLVCNTNYVQLAPSDKVAQVANISFDAATFEIWGALLNGAQLIGISRDAILPAEFFAQIRQQEISVLFLTTALFNQIVSEVPGAFSSLRYLLFGGERADPQSVRAVLEQGPPQQLLHVYGPTENTTFSSWYCVKNVLEGATSIPIGRAIANTQIYLLDNHLNPVPIGVTGEIYLGGDGLARGYLNRPELTAERFVPNPFTQSDTRLYRSGDLGRLQPDGNVEFLGRADDQVKLRGFRIELGEIEAALGQHPAIQEVVVAVQEIESDTPEEPLRDCLRLVADHRRLVAYIVPHQQPVPTNKDLRSFLKSKLPDYMVPSAFTVLKALPLTRNGKVDRHALPLAEVVSAESAVIPRTSTEAMLAEIWTKLLGVPVGVHDNFFELGGHSLLATQLILRVRATFRIEVPLRRLFETPTIAELAQYIETVSWAQKISGAGSTADNSSEVMRSHIASLGEPQNREEVEL